MNSPDLEEQLEADVYRLLTRRSRSSSRSKHSETEQRRRSKINERFQALMDIIPQKLQNLDAQFGHEEFGAEIKGLHRADHPNVIKLLGKAFGPKIRGLVYEYMPKGSLDHFLFAALPPPRVTPGLTWNRRMKVAVGVAEGLVYLHTTLKVLHLDVKVGNVLLDQDFTPKLTDFGLSMKMAQDDAGEEIPRSVDPIKADVYSYGIFLLQLLTGRKSFDFSRPEQKRKLADWLMPVCTNEQNVAMMMDLNLGGRFPEAARMCINPQVHARPHMAFVESMIRDAAAFEVPEWSPIERRRSWCPERPRL